MELPRPRPFDTEGSTRATLDFLSLCPSSAPAQQDPTPSEGSNLKTQDFLQPLERVGIMDDGKKIPPSAPCNSGDHPLPGGIGTYSISNLNQRNPEGSLFTAQTSITAVNDENSNSSSYTGSGFTLWDESAAKKGKAMKENISEETNVLQGVNVAVTQWPSALERLSPSSSNNQHNATTFSSFSSSQPSSSQKNQSFFNMIKSGKKNQEYDDDDNKEFVMKKVSPSQLKGKFCIKAEMKTVDEKPHTPRSKHSATEQRRRSKINDRFQNLREIVPNSNQKRDKASFLSEVIEYIQLLQEKVNKYESPYSVWNREPNKMVQWRNCHVPESFTDHLRGMNIGLASASVYTSKVEGKNGATSNIPVNRKNLVDSSTSMATTLKDGGQKTEPVVTTTPIHAQSQTNILSFGRANAFTAPLPSTLASDTDKPASSWHPSQFRKNRSSTDYLNSDNKLKEQGLSVESGTISISSAYSQRLLCTLTQALQTSGVDLSQANISVKINMGKRANGANSSVSTIKEDKDVLSRSKVASESEYSKAGKRPRTV